MPVTLGDLQYKIEANTQGLDKAIGTIQKLSTVLDGTRKAVESMVSRFDRASQNILQSTRRSTSAVSRSTEVTTQALVKQRRSVELLEEKFNEFRKRASQLNLRPERIAAVSRSFKALEKAVRSGTLSTEDFATKQQKFNISLRRGTKELTELEKSTNRAAQSQRASESALARQFTASSRANIKTQEMIETLRRIRGSEKAIQEVTNAFQQFKTQMDGGPLSALQMAKAQAAFNETLTAAKIKLTGAGTVSGKFRLRMQELAKSVQIALGPLSGVASRITAFTSLSGQANAIVASTIATLIGLGTALAASVRFGSRAENQMLALSSALLISGKAGGLSARRIDEVSREMAELNLSSQEANRQISRLFVTSGLPGDENLLRRVLGISQGLSEIGSSGSGAALENARKVLRLLENPLENLNTLNEAGIRFDSVQQELIKSLELSGDFLEAREVILKRLAVVEVSAAKGAEGLTGAFDTLKETLVSSLVDTARQSGILEVLSGAINQATGRLKILTRDYGINIAIGKALTFVVEKIVGVLALLANHFGIIIRLTGIWLSLIVVRKVIGFGAAIFGLTGTLLGFASSIGGAILGLIGFFVQVRKVGLLSILTGAISNLIAKSTILTSVMTLAQGALVRLIPVLRAATAAALRFSLALLATPQGLLFLALAASVGALTFAFIKLRNTVKDGSLVKFLLDIKKGIEDFVNNGIRFLENLKETLDSKLVKAFKDSAESLRGIFKGIIDNEVVDTVIRSFDSLTERLSNGISSFLDSEAVKKFTNFLRGVFKSSVDQISSVGKDLFGLGKSAAQGIGGFLESVVGSAASGAKAVGGSIGSAVNSVFNSISSFSLIPKIDTEELRASSDAATRAFTGLSGSLEKFKSSAENLDPNGTLVKRVENFSNAVKALDRPVGEIFTAAAIESLKKALESGDVERILSLLDSFDEVLRQANREFTTTDEIVKKLGERFIGIRGDFGGLFEDILKGEETEAAFKKILENSDKIAESFSGSERQARLFSDSLGVIAFVVKKTADPVNNAINGIRQNLNDLRLESKLVGANSKDFFDIKVDQKLLEAARALRLPVETIEELNSLTGETAERIRALRSEFENTTKQEIFTTSIQDIQDLNDSLSLAQVEFRTLGKESLIRRTLIALREKEIDLRKKGIDLNGEEGKRALELTSRLQAQIDLNERLGESVEAVKSALASSFTGFLDAIREGQDELKKFGDIFTSVLNSILDQLLQLTIVQPIVNSFGSLLAQIVPSLAGLILPGTVNAAGPSFFDASAFNASNFSTPGGLNLGSGFATGGIIGGPGVLKTGSTIRPVGESGPEAVLPLTRIGGILGVRSASGGSGGVQVNIFDQRTNPGSSPVEVKEGRGTDGLRQISIFIRDEVRSMLNSGELDSPLKGNFGLSRRGRR